MISGKQLYNIKGIILSPWNENDEHGTAYWSERKMITSVREVECGERTFSTNSHQESILGVSSWPQNCSGGSLILLSQEA